METKNITLENFTEKLGFVFNVALLLIHATFLAMFAILKIHIMVGMNILSVTTYLLLFIVYKRNIVAYLHTVNIEIIIHMILAVMCVGWDCGFQLYLFASVPIAFYNDYISIRNSKKLTYPGIISLIILLIFVTVRIITFGTPPIYQLKYELTSLFVFLINTIVVFVFMIVYMTAYKNMVLEIQNKLKRSAEYDELTGLANRYRANTAFKQIFSGTKKNDIQLAVAILDIDNFKKVNDRYGHDIGDKALQALSDILKSVESSNVFACRWGGEEFLIVGTGKDCYEKIADKAETIRTKLMSTDIPLDEGDNIRISISAGVTFYNGSENIENTIARADKFLYEAKNSGKNKVITGDDTASIA